ncbi:casein kinase II, beta subunit [Trichoderma reesei QM6a]|uniref:Casein kinase II subunit beta n=3 Tax=Trichoderma TaxID=5543 RepID=G0RWH4_HYPJQ|nr:casein kinase II, beta subunit [Trichoderma reesei QM6a]EGR44479.1 casein kinase II, beta subunit [Trichoderma reesei QM6a]ETR97202.1 casein kinase II regulatory subunit [Trichoderma reesei RUT C-30]OTA03483.1 casein kinase II, beta (regulatory) subunit [Trichoderma parareesei]
MSTSSGTPESWIASFCALPGHEYFAEVSEEFIEDDFNLTGLQTQVAMYKEALEMILDVEPEDDEDDEEEEEDDDENESGLEEADRADLRHGAERRHHSRMASDLSVIESSAEMLYGLIHQRFICSRVGIQQMSEKYEFGHFGCCPRTHCEQARTLPVGLSDIPGEDTVKLFCPSCLDVYVPPNSRFQTVDGAFFGRTFGALFLLTFPEYDLTKRGADVLSTTNSKVPDDERIINGMYAKNIAPGLGRGHIYEPKIYGFKVSERARSGPRMQWLRDRPDDITELDEARLYHEQNPDSEEEDDESMAVNGRALVRRRLPGNARLRQRQNHSGSPMALSANGAESEL